MRSALLIIQYTCIAALSVECAVIFSHMKNRLHAYLLLDCIALLVNNLGYLQEITSKTMDAYLASLKLSYSGRVWIAFFFMLFITELVKKKIPGFLVTLGCIAHVGIYVTILMLPEVKLYYTSMQFAVGGIFPRLSHENGIVYDVLIGLQIIYILYGLTILLMEIKKEKRKKEKRCLKVVLAATLSMVAFYNIQIFAVGKITDVYDVTMLGYFIGTIFMFYAIFRHDLLGMKEIARDFVVDRLSEGILAVDAQGSVSYYNEPMEKLFPTIKTSPEKVLKEVIRAEEFDENINKNDRIFIPEKNTLTYQGKTVGTLYALVDETEHFRYMAELEEQKAIADRANQAKSTFLANMSHEIRTPINAVIGMDEMILRESEEPQTRKYASDIMSAGNTLLSLINDILDLSKVEEGKMEIIPVQYELSSLINDLMNMVRARAEKKELQLEIHVDEHTPSLLYGDETRVRQCALNLLTNAVKYTEQGTVTLDISFEKKDDEHILLKICVRDTGIGIRDEDREKLFASFTRLEEERNRNIEGTGLGMNITVQLLELMGSQLEVESEYGQGSTFSFTVEQKVERWEEIGDFASRYEKSEEHVYRELFHAPEARILVVDDTEVNLSVIENLLKRTGLMIDTATSGKDALELAEEKIYDAIFLDHMMPDMDGIETLKRIRKNGKNTETPTVALTANAISGAREMYLEAGFTTYLSKPVDGEKLEKLLYKLLPSDKIESADSPLPERQTETKEVSTDTETVPEDVQLPPELTDIPELNVKEGVRNGGTPEGYLSILSVFYRTAAAKADELDTLYQKDDIPGYTIKVHALKSSARIVGAVSLSELAKSLEDAGNRDDREYLAAHHEELITMYRELEKKLAFLQPKEEPRSDLGDAEMREAYQTILEIAASMDFDLMDELMKDLEQYRLSTEDEERLKQIRALCLAMDWDGIQKSAEERLAQFGK